MDTKSKIPVGIYKPTRPSASHKKSLSGSGMGFISWLSFWVMIFGAGALLIYFAGQVPF